MKGGMTIMKGEQHRDEIDMERRLFGSVLAEEEANAAVVAAPAEEPTPEHPDDEAGPEQDRSVRPRVYAASLSDYNAGILHGAWLPADALEAELHEGIEAMLADSPMASRSGQPAEEWAIHDSEGFNGLHIDEHEGLGFVARIGRGIAEHGVAFAHWAARVSTDEELDAFEDRYRGHYASLHDYADQLLEDLGAQEALEAVPDWLQPHIELHVGRFANDLLLGGDLIVSHDDSGVHIWSS